MFIIREFDQESVLVFDSLKELTTVRLHQKTILLALIDTYFLRTATARRHQESKTQGSEQLNLRLQAVRS